MSQVNKNKFIINAVKVKKQQEQKQQHFRPRCLISKTNSIAAHVTFNNTPCTVPTVLKSVFFLSMYINSGQHKKIPLGLLELVLKLYFYKAIFIFMANLMFCIYFLLGKNNKHIFRVRGLIRLVRDSKLCFFPSLLLEKCLHV